MCECVIAYEAKHGNDWARRCVDRPCWCHERGCPMWSAYQTRDASQR